MIEVQYDKAQIMRLERRLSSMPQKVPVVLSRAINKTATFARAGAAREIKKEANIKIGDIKKSMGLTKANRSRLESVMDVNAKRIPLAAFGARQLKSGVSYRITARKKITGAFIAKVYPHYRDGALQLGRVNDNAHVGVFKRRGKRRLPIDERYGPSIGHLFQNAGGILKRWEQTADKRLTMEINRQIEVALKK